MTDPDDKDPKDPEVLEPEPEPTKPVQYGPKVARGNPAWQKGMPSPNPGGPTKGQRKTALELKGKIKDWLNDVGFERLTEIAMDADTDPAIASGTILKLAAFVLPPAKEVDGGDGVIRPEDPLLTALRALAQPKKKEP